MCLLGLLCILIIRSWQTSQSLRIWQNWSLELWAASMHRGLFLIIPLTPWRTLTAWPHTTSASSLQPVPRAHCLQRQRNSKLMFLLAPFLAELCAYMVPSCQPVKLNVLWCDHGNNLEWRVMETLCFCKWQEDMRPQYDKWTMPFWPRMKFSPILHKTEQNIRCALQYVLIHVPPVPLIGSAFASLWLMKSGVKFGNTWGDAVLLWEPHYNVAWDLIGAFTNDAVYFNHRTFGTCICSSFCGSTWTSLYVSIFQTLCDLHSTLWCTIKVTLNTLCYI